ncbi:hypothetical protein HJFPF1_07745 [Paramyrothecium foliicola]|nr:hypothetical protein HJFPF1_07745 [Paramyrothecium foliicola]
MSSNQNKSTSAGQKVDLGRDAPVTREATGKVNSESLAAESKREGGAFTENRGEHRSARTENVSSHQSSTSDADSGLRATVKDNAPTNPTSFAKASNSGRSENTSQSSAETAPTYVASQYIRDESGPHGKNLTEGGWDESKAKDGLKAALSSEPGSENDPSRLAEMQFQQNQVRGGRDAGPKQDDLTTETKYDGLNYYKLTLPSNHMPLLIHANSVGHESQQGPFLTNTLPEIFDNTIIIAAASPSIRTAHARDKDGWFLSDFYAFNYLLKGAGLQGTEEIQVDGKLTEVQGQTWLTAADPRKVIGKWHDQKVLLHGNPYTAQREVLSNDLLDAKEYNDITIVESDDMIDAFVTAVKHGSELARKKDAPLLLLVFCHGLQNHQLLLNDNDINKGLTIAYLKGAIEPGCRATLVTPSCYAGGRVVDPQFNHTTIAASNAIDTSTAWLPSASMSRSCGSIFACSLIEKLTSVSSPLLDEPQQEPSDDTLQPTEASMIQTEAYNQFCRSIFEACAQRTRCLWNKQYFTFDAQDDRWDDLWTGRTGIPLAQFQARWNRLCTINLDLEPGQC